MRNYVSELKERGLSTHRLKKETGLSAKKLSDLSSGKVRLRSGTKLYEKIRNTSRRVAYREMRESGIQASKASRLRRTVYSPLAKEIELPQTSIDLVTTGKGVRYYLRLVGEFINEETGEKVTLEGFSIWLKEKDESIQKEEACQVALGTLDREDRYDFKLSRVVEMEWIKAVSIGKAEVRTVERKK